jgi:hypothetical protein
MVDHGALHKYTVMAIGLATVLNIRKSRASESVTVTMRVRQSGHSRDEVSTRSEQA